MSSRVVVLFLGFLLITSALLARVELTEPVGVTWGFKPDLAIDPVGNLHLVVYEGGLSYVKKAPDQEWYEALVEHVPYSEDSVHVNWSRASIDGDEFGNAHIMWTMHDSLFYSRRAYGMWDDPRVIAYKWGPDWATVGSNATVYDPVYHLLHIIYARCIGDVWSMWHMYSWDYGTSWSGEVCCGWDGMKPNASVDSEGRVHINFRRRAANGVGYNVWNPATNSWIWGEGFDVVTDLAADETCLAVSPDGTPHTIWPTFECSGDDCYYLPTLYSRRNTAGWEEAYPATDFDHYYCEEGNAYLPGAVAFSPDEIVVFHYQEQYETLYYSYYKDGVWQKDNYFAPCHSGFFNVVKNGSEAIVVYRADEGQIFERRFITSRPSDWQVGCMVDTNLDYYRPGDQFRLYGGLYTNEPDTKYVDMYLLMEVLGNYYFFPTWGTNLEKVSLPLSIPGYQLTFMEFPWPTGTGTFNGVNVHMALMAAGTYDLAGGVYGYSTCSFGFTDVLPTATPTRTPIPTNTPVPTNTPLPTNTPIPTDTPTPFQFPTKTPTPNL